MSQISILIQTGPLQAISSIPHVGELPRIMIPYLGEFVKREYQSTMYSKDKSYQRAYKTFRERLIEARRAAGLTQGEVSRSMKRTRTYVSKCEIGERRVDFVELVRLARIYRKNLEFFVVE